MEMVISFPGDLRVDARFGQHVVHTDQPHDGDEGTAPTPFATFLASIGTCAGIYVLGFCRQRGLKADGIRIVERVIPGPGGIARIGLEIHVPEDFPPKYHAALIRSAEQCAVKKQLEAPPRFDITVVENHGTASPQSSAR
jgi:putative redox protein